MKVRHNGFIHILIWLVFTVSSYSFAQGNTQVPPSGYIGIGYPAVLFPDTDQRDVKAAMKIWSEEIIKRMALDYESQNFIFENLQSYLEAIKTG